MHFEHFFSICLCFSELNRSHLLYAFQHKHTLKYFPVEMCQKQLNYWTNRLSIHTSIWLNQVIPSPSLIQLQLTFLTNSPGDKTYSNISSRELVQPSSHLKYLHNSWYTHTHKQDTDIPLWTVYVIYFYKPPTSHST